VFLSGFKYNHFLINAKDEAVLQRQKQHANTP